MTLDVDVTANFCVVVATTVVVDVFVATAVRLWVEVTSFTVVEYFVVVVADMVIVLVVIRFKHEHALENEAAG
jgi:hypothetical protein